MDAGDFLEECCVCFMTEEGRVESILLRPVSNKEILLTGCSKQLYLEDVEFVL